MNKVELLGRLTKNPEIRYGEGENQVAVGRYTLAVMEKGRRSGSGFYPMRHIWKVCHFCGKVFLQRTVGLYCWTPAGAKLDR